MAIFRKAIIGLSASALLSMSCAASAPEPSTPKVSLERISVPIVSVQWPMQMNNSLVRRAMEQASNAARLCATQIEVLSCEKRKAYRVGRTTSLVAGIFGAATAAGVSSAQLVNEGAREEYTTVWAVAGGLATAVMAAVGAFGNADQRGQQASERVGAIEQAVAQFIEGWNATLLAKSPRLGQNQKGCEHVIDPDTAGIAYMGIEHNADGLKWAVATKGAIATKKQRCGLPEIEQLNLDRELNALVTKLMMVCGSSTHLASANCENEARRVGDTNIGANTNTGPEEKEPPLAVKGSKEAPVPPTAPTPVPPTPVPPSPEGAPLAPVEVEAPKG